MAGGHDPFDTVMTLHRAEPGPRARGPSAGAFPEAGGDPGNRALNLVVRLGDEGLGLRLDYRPDLYSEADAERMLHALARLLEAVEKDPTQAVGRMQLLDDAEQGQMLAGWSATDRAESQAVLADILGRPARATPDAIALVGPDQTLTYGQLDRRANQLARLLAARGCRVGTVVALALPRSIDLVTAVLAVARTGAAFLPVDPGHD